MKAETREAERTNTYNPNIFEVMYTRKYVLVLVLLMIVGDS